MSIFGLFRHMSLMQIIRRALFRLSGSVITLPAQGRELGYVLLSYTTTPYTLLSHNKATWSSHTNYWETDEIATAFREHGYTVDVIDATNSSFIPKKSYSYYLDVRDSLDRLGPLLGEACVKIFHATGAYWKFQNDAEKKRLADLYERRGVKLRPQRVAPNSHVEHADMIVSLCGPFPESTYDFLQKPLYHVPLSTSHTYPSPELKDMEHARKQFIWLGGAGAVHKGLDLVLEAFKNMPEYTLLVCGKFSTDMDFLETYRTELFDTPNIKHIGYIDPGSAEFERIRNESLAIVYPSCSEGCAGSVVVSMHAGLIPIVSREAGVITNDFGIELANSSIEEIQRAVQSLASLSSEELHTRTMDTWRYANKHHTRSEFGKAIRAFVDTLEQNRQ